MAEHHIGEFYTTLYTHSSGHDSPRQSRTNMRRRIIAEIEKQNRPLHVLGLGAGRGEVEGTLLRNARGGGDRSWQEYARESQFVTVDIADIPRRKLVGSRGRQHVRADSRNLPFADGSFDIVTSNLSIDMLRRNENGDYEKALGEMSRVTKMGEGAVLLSFHLASLYDNLSEFYRGKEGVAADYYSGDSASNPFYSTDDEIFHDLASVGLQLTTIELVSETGKNDGWWEVTAYKN